MQELEGRCLIYYISIKDKQQREDEGPMETKKMITIDEAAQLLGISKDTVRRRIKDKEYIAKKQVGPFGLQWYLPEDQFNKAMVTEEVIQVTRAVPLAELHGIIRQSMQEAIQEETKGLREQIESLQGQLAAAQETNAAQQKIITEALEGMAKRSLWSRLFG